MTKFIEKIRIKAGKYLMNKKLAKLNRKVIVRNLEEIENAGIIFDATNSDNIELVKKFINELKKFGVKTKALGYIHDHRKNIDVIGNENFGYITKDDYSFFYEPKDKLINSFIDEKFGLLIVYCENDYFPLYQISALSVAELKAGEKNVFEDVLDIMIEIPKNKGLEELQKYLIHYLSIINKPNNN
ncbi:MAG: hypothetical protein GXO47_13565 [Chlorobi bacterium]|nr:hypothetical protein [Chlorobiota bacterium]